jgi:hypothetical protein
MATLCHTWQSVEMAATFVCKILKLFNYPLRMNPACLTYLQWKIILELFKTQLKAAAAATSYRVSLSWIFNISDKWT